MEARTVRYRDKNYNVLIRLRQARVVEGIKRSTIIQENLGRETVKAAAEGEDALQLTVEGISHRVVAIYTYPACIAATVAVENLETYTGADGEEHPFTNGLELKADLSLEEFLELPEALVLMWEGAAYELNPHWAPRLVPREDEEGKDKEPSVKQPSTES